MYVVVAMGAVVIALAVLRLPASQIGWPSMLLALAAIAISSSFVVRIPSVTGGITVGDTFIFLALLLYGGSPAIILAAADGFCSSLRVSRRPRTILFNTATMACSTFLTAGVLQLIFGNVDTLTAGGYSANFLAAVCIMAMTQYAANSGLIALEKSFKIGRQFWSTWKEFYLWSSVTYIAGASAAGFIACFVGVFSLYAVALATPIAAIVYLTYRTYLKNVEAAAEHIRQAERHVEELNHYIEELKRAEEERDGLLLREREARGVAEAACRLKDDFLATVSHELRTPLTSILGWSNLLRSGALDEESTAKAFDVIERNAQNQKRLIDDLLDVSRIIGGKLLLDVREIELARIVEDAVEVVRPAAAAKGIRVVSSFDPEVWTVSGDAGRLRQVVWNLLSNAVKFTPEGGHVEVRVERDGSRARVAVSDTGKGIAPDFLPHVFERFRQADAKTTRAFDGLGLGLAIVRHLVEAHGGTVRAESPGEGLGTTFSIYLPLSAVRATSPARTDHLGLLNASGVSVSLRGVRVLAVDDNSDTRDLVEVVLNRCGAEVRSSASAGEALDVLGEWRPDVLLSDIGMPHEDGYELIRRVRSLEASQGGRVPAAALTAYARDEDRGQTLAAGFQMHLVKPVNPAELIAAVASLARQSASCAETT
jgi:signal transduction histidine kinase/ActR/RegA family two-component response regulator